MAELQLSNINSPAAVFPEEMIRRDEITYHATIRRIADHIILGENIKLILLAGPSGSGKTTTANLLSDAIRARDEGCMVVSLDDFYKVHSDPSYPRREDGELDFECPEALDLDLLHTVLSDIVANRPFSVPKYDFKVGGRVAKKDYPPVGHGCVIIEGLHALNPMFWGTLPKENLFKIFVSVSTNINVGDERILSGRKVRFLRRLVRDSIFRGADATRTLSMWQEVLKAEDVYLYPYKNLADVALNTFHSFELGVMRPFADRLLRISELDGDPYVETVRAALERIITVDVSLVPANSLIREFVAGGIYEKIY